MGPMKIFTIVESAEDSDEKTWTIVRSMGTRRRDKPLAVYVSKAAAEKGVAHLTHRNRSPAINRNRDTRWMT
jgi:hypothetical protein